MNDLNAALPASVTVAFPKKDDGAFDGTATEIEVTLASLALPEVGAATGFPGTYTLICTATADHAAGSPTNTAELTALAEQIARDYYRHRLARVHARFGGVVDWQPEGLSDLVEWEVGPTDSVTTWVSRGPSQPDSAEALHVSGSSGSGGIPVGGSTTFTGDVTFAGGSVNFHDTTINVSGSSTTTYATGTTTTYESGSTLVLAGTTVNVTEDTTITIDAGDTLTFTGGDVVFDVDSSLTLVGIVSITSTDFTFEATSSVVVEGGWCWEHYACHEVFTDELVDSQTHDYAGSVLPWWLLTTDTSGDYFLTGIVAPAGTCDGCEIVITNDGPGVIFLQHEDTDSDEANRLFTPTGEDWEIAEDYSAWLRYDRTLERWRIITDHTDSGSAAVFSGAQVHQAGAASGAGVQSYDTEDYDTDGYFSVLSPTQFTVPTTDKYRVGVYSAITSTGVGLLRDAYGSIQVNGTAVRSQGFIANAVEPDRFNTVFVDFEAELDLAASDTIKFAITATSGTGVAGNNSRMWISRVIEGGGGGGGSGHVVEDEGTPLTARASLNFVGAGVTATDDSGNDATVITIPGVADGDKGDITVSASGATWSIDNDAVTYAKLQNVSATARVLGRKTAAAGNVEECTLSEVLDMIGSASRGDLLIRGVSTWARLVYSSSYDRALRNTSSNEPSWQKVGELLAVNWVSTVEGATFTSFNDLTSLDQVTISLGEAGNVIVLYVARVTNTGAGNSCFNIVNVAGSDDTSTISHSTSAGAAYGLPSTCAVQLSLTSGPHTIKIRHRVDAGTGEWGRRLLAVFRVP